MMCEFCRGTGIWDGDVETINGPMAVQHPCSECNGTGIADCCNGMTAEQVIDYAMEMSDE